MTMTLSSAIPREYAQEFSSFISASPTSYHAASEVAQRLTEGGYSEQNERDEWSGTQRGFALRDGAVIAWRIPDNPSADVGFRIAGSHTDSPSFKLKPNVSTHSHGYGQVNVEVYGGPLLNSWLNRDLGIAGRLVTIDGHTHLVKTGPIMVIPQLAPHLDRSVNKELKLSAQCDLHPVWTVDEGDISDAITRRAGVDIDRVAAADLFAYDTQDPCMYGGAGDDFFAAGRQDNLSSVYAALTAFLHTSHSDCDDIAIFAAFDHEEIGSRTASGAAGPFLEAILRRLAHHVRGAGSEVFERMIANSSCLSVDAGHAVNPNRAEYHDPAHQPVLGGGPLLKVNASGAYASEAQGSALFLRCAAQGGVDAIQPIVSNNDVPSGSTIGPITATRLGMTTIDCGVPLLSMHSAREISSPRDLLEMAKILGGYFEGA